MNILNPMLDTPTPVAPAPQAQSWFDAPTWGRRPNLDLAMDHVRRAFPAGGGLIVEVGSMRTPGNVDGDGCASVAWGTLAREVGDLVLSVDVDPLATGFADRLRRFGLPVFGVTGRAQEALGLLPRTLPVHVLYLDGSDDPMEALDQLALVRDRLPPGALILVDDARPKGEHVARLMDQEVALGRAEPFRGLDPRWNQMGWVLR